MPRLSTTRWQVAVVVGLFLGSLGVLLFNLFATLDLPRQELVVRRNMQAAGQRLADAAAAVKVPAATEAVPRSDPIDRQLREITSAVLQDYPGIEGGFYVVASGGWFAGYAFPTDPHGRDGSFPRTEPPPLEAALIKDQLVRYLDRGRPSCVPRTWGRAASSFSRGPSARPGPPT
jgi:hypothetical protein